MRRLCAYYGWDLPAWAESIEPDLIYLRGELATAVQNQEAKVAARPPSVGDLASEPRSAAWPNPQVSS